MSPEQTLQVALPGLGAVVILAALAQTRAVFQALEFVRDPPRSRMERSLRNYRGVMVFFLFGNILTASAFHLGWQGMAPTLIGLIFLLASVFVLYSIFLQQSLVRELMRTLQELIPMCSVCKRIRKADGDPYDDEDWVGVDTYLLRRTGRAVSHGVCPSCVSEAYGEA